MSAEEDLVGGFAEVGNREEHEKTQRRPAL